MASIQDHTASVIWSVIGEQNSVGFNTNTTTSFDGSRNERSLVRIAKNRGVEEF